MEPELRSSEGFIKKKNSSGLLIVKKKTNPGLGLGLGLGPVPRGVLRSNEERERRGLSVSYSGSSEDGSGLYSEGIMGNSKFGRNGGFEYERRRKFSDVGYDDNVGTYRKRTKTDNLLERINFAGSNAHSRGYEPESSVQLGSGSVVRSRFDIDDDGANLPVSPSRQRFHVPLNKTIRVQGKNGVLKVMVNKAKNMHVIRRFYGHQMEDADRRGSESHMIDENLSVGPPLYSDLRRSDNVCDLRLRNCSFTKRAKAGDSGTEDSNSSFKPEARSMVYKKKNMHPPHRISDYQQHDANKRVSNSEISIGKSAPVSPMLYSDTKHFESANLLFKAEKIEVKAQNSFSKREVDDSEIEDSDSSLKIESRSEKANSSLKRMKGEEKNLSVEKPTPVRGKETKVKRGTGTEKQLLREKIRHILANAGWTIDYRPRKNRDYLDAVYISPIGTAYWSIIKAYEAFKKQLGDEDVQLKCGEDPSSLTPVPEELLNKLTRQTKKKLEKEMKMKQRDQARSKNGKEVAMEKAEEDSENDVNDEKWNDNSSKRRLEKIRSLDANSHTIRGRTTKQIGQCNLLVPNSYKGLNSETDGYVPYVGKRTLLSWLIDSGTVQISAKVQYMNRKRTRVMLKGWIARDGIHCGCCSKILTVSKFEIHAGSKLRQPFQNIFLESGVSLLQCQLEAWNRQDEVKRCGFYNVNGGDDADDDACGVCGDGGDLICCDGCPSTFHQSCLGIQTLPFGDWHCPNCTCKFCERCAGQGNAGVTAFSTCSLCEKKYHVPCREEIDTSSAAADFELSSFCGKKCQEVYNKLQKLLEVKHELEGGFSWSLIHRTDLDTDVSQHEFPQRVECNSKLAVALSVMDECFLPIIDRRSGINLVHSVLYNCGSNFSRLNYSGFYTAILERGDEIIAAASVRIHGTQLAEMPFIGTRHIYRRQGMCRRLLGAIELALSSLKVEKLVIPAIGEHMRTWTEVFGFNPLKESHKKEMRSMKMLVFPRTDLLQKILAKQNSVREKAIAESGEKSILSKEEHHFTPDATKNSDGESSSGHDSNAAANLTKIPKVDDKIASIDSCSRDSAVLSNGNASSKSFLDVPSNQTSKC